MQKLIPATPDLQLWHLLESCRVTQTKQVEGTKHITCQAALAFYLGREVLSREGQQIPQNLVKMAFVGCPVKEVWGIVNGTIKRMSDVMEVDRYLRARARKRLERGEVNQLGEATATDSQGIRGDVRPA